MLRQTRPTSRGRGVSFFLRCPKWTRKLKRGSRSNLASFFGGGVGGGGGKEKGSQSQCTIARRAPQKSQGSRPHVHGRRSKSPTCTAGPFTQAAAPRGFPSKLAAYARWTEQASRAVHRWKNRSWVEQRRTLGTERDLYQAKFRKNMTAQGLHRPSTSKGNGTWSQ